MSEKNGSAYKTARGALYITTKNLVTGIVGSLFMVFLARFLPSVSDFGLYNGLQIMIMIATIVAGLGLANATIRFIPYHIGAGRINQAREIGTLIFRIGLISSFVLALILFVIADYIAIFVFHDINYTGLIHLISIDVFFFSMVNFSSYILFSFQEFKQVAIIMAINPVIRYTGAFVLLTLGLGIEGVIIGIICGDVATFLIFIRLLKRQGLVGIGSIRNHIHLLRTLLNYSIPIFGSQILQTLIVYIDYYLVLSVAGLFNAGIYSPATLIGLLYLTILIGASEPLLPFFSKIYGKSGISSLNEVSIFTSRYVFFIFFPLGIALLAGSAPLITLTFGEKYSQAIYPTMIIILITTLISLGIVFNFILMSAGYSRLFFAASLVALIIQIIVSVAIVPSLGANGAAFARALAYTIMFFYPAYRLKKIAGLHYDLDALRKGLAGSVIMGSIIFILNYYLSYAYFLPFSLLVGFFSYLVFLRFTRAMRVQDFEIMNNILSNKFRWPITLAAKIVIRGN
jgi:stage V sporulation protein B